MNHLAKKKPKKIDDFKLEEIDGEILLYSPKATQAVYLNQSAAVIWQMCNGELSTQEIIEVLQHQFPEDASTIADDVIETIEQLVSSKAIRLI